MSHDDQSRRAVIADLEGEPSVTAADIGGTANAGAVAVPVDRTMMSGMVRRTFHARSIRPEPRRREWADIAAMLMALAAERRRQSRAGSQQTCEVAGFYLL